MKVSILKKEDIIIIDFLNVFVQNVLLQSYLHLSTPKCNLIQISFKNKVLKFKINI